jgi:hypothetical protein
MRRQKQVDITDDVLALIERVTSTSIDADNIVVFEAAAASTRPISKVGSIYDGARMTREMLQEMAEGLNSGQESVPLHTLHQQGGEIPKGRVFSATLHDEIDGSATLRAMFYLPLAEKELIQKINLSILDEVSVGTKSQQALCSKCGFDYFGADSDFSNFWNRTCEHGHVIGEDGTHLKLDGLDKWMELSLVSRGASDNPKILSRAKQLVSKDEHDRMAASGTPLEALVLFTSMATETPEMPKTPKELAAEAADALLAATEAEGAKDKTSEFDAAIAFAELQASIPQMIADAVAAAAPAAVEAELEAEPTVESLQAELATAQSRITDLEAAAAEETAEEAEPTDADIEVPTGGVAASAITDAKTLTASLGRANSFKTKR